MGEVGLLAGEFQDLSFRFGGHVAFFDEEAYECFELCCWGGLCPVVGVAVVSAHEVTPLA